MNKLLFFVLFICLSGIGFSQTTIALSEVATHVGDSVTVEGKIYGVKVFSGASSPVLLDLGAAFPNQSLTIAVFPAYKTDGATMPTEASKGGIAKVSGRIELYKGKPQIAVRYSNQLTITPDGGTPVKQ